MQRTLIELGLLGLVAVASSQLRASELGDMRPLQVGPIGSGLTPSFFKGSEFETQIRLQQMTGEEKTSSEKLESQSLQRTLAVGLGITINEGAAFVLQSSLSQWEYNASTRAEDHTFKQTSSSASLGAGPVVKIKNISLKGTVFFLQTGESPFRYRSPEGEKEWTVEEATVPYFLVQGGYQGDNTQVVLGVQVYNGAMVDVTASDEVGEEQQFETLVGVPGQLQLDLTYEHTPKVQFAASATYFTTAQSSPRTNEWNLTYTGTGNSLRRDTTGSRRDGNHLRFDLGGIYYPEPWVSFLGAMHVTTSAADSEDNVRLWAQNLGRKRIDIGAQYYMTVAKVYFNAGYNLPEQSSYTNPSQEEADWIPSGEAVEVALYGTELEVGVSTFF